MSIQYSGNIYSLKLILFKFNINCWNYKGFKLYEGWTIDRVSPDISPETFFEEYVAKRKPVIISGHLKDGEWKGHLWVRLFTSYMH